ncbi:MAG: putative rane protein, partial [Acidobacteria bacterium]|nr:putative rane protein [Acidobacteriota bacterium]
MRPYQSLLARIRLVRRRWRLQKIAKGLAFLLAVTIALLILGVWGADLFGFRPGAVWAMRLITGGAAIFVAVRFFVLPLRRRLSDLQIAQYVEERYPQLEDRLVAAVEFGEDKAMSPGMLDLLIRDTIEKTSRLDFSVFLNRRRLAAYGALGLVAFVVLVALLNWGPPFFRYGFDRMYVQWSEAATRTPLVIEVAPGDAQLARGLDQQIRAQLIGFDAADVRLFTQPDASSAWTPVAMEPDPFGSSFLYLLVDVQSTTQYYVEAREVRSKTYTIRVVDSPRVDRIDLTYHFPPYTGMAVQRVEGEGDISAIAGTRVELSIHTNQPVHSARLLFDDQSTMPLAAAGEAGFSGAITLKRSGSYVVQLADAGGRL